MDDRFLDMVTLERARDEYTRDARFRELYAAVIQAKTVESKQHAVDKCVAYVESLNNPGK